MFIKLETSKLHCCFAVILCLALALQLLQVDYMYLVQELALPGPLITRFSRSGL